MKEFNIGDEVYYDTGDGLKGFGVVSEVQTDEYIRVKFEYTNKALRIYMDRLELRNEWLCSVEYLIPKLI